MTGPPDDEFALIRRHFVPLAAAMPAARGLADDAAVLSLRPGHELVITTDALVGGVHFPLDEAPEVIARRTLRVNLSDLGAMGARPLAYTLAGAFTPDCDDAWFGAFARGLALDQATFDIALIGGDTVASAGPLTLALTAFGEVPAGTAIARAGANAGDDIFVSGTIGDAVLGLALVTGARQFDDQAAVDWLVARYQLPSPRVALGLRLRGLASAAIDVSDGLIGDLGHICTAAVVDACVEAGAVALSGPARMLVTNDKPLALSLLAGGDDYELLFTAAPERRDDIAKLSDELDLTLSRIGAITTCSGDTPVVRIIDNDDQIVEVGNSGYRHFRDRSIR